MRSLLLAVSITFLFSVTAQAADIICSCSGDQKCSDIIINFVPSNPGVYMTIEYAYGDRNQEGFATVRREKSTGETVFTLGNFLLVEKNNKYRLPQKPHDCNGTI